MTIEKATWHESHARLKTCPHANSHRDACTVIYFQFPNQNAQIKCICLDFVTSQSFIKTKEASINVTGKFATCLASQMTAFFLRGKLIFQMDSRSTSLNHAFHKLIHIQNSPKSSLCISHNWGKPVSLCTPLCMLNLICSDQSLQTKSFLKFLTEGCG